MKTIDTSKKDKELSDRICALATYLQLTDCDDKEAIDYDENFYNGDCLEFYADQYLVVTGERADELVEERLNDYLDEIVTPQLPERLEGYFDYEYWKQDARLECRGRWLAEYDGVENEVKIDGTCWYIYRLN